MSLLSGYNTQQVSLVISAGSVTAGTTTLPILRAPFGGVTITDAYIMPTTAIVANGSTYVTATLLNGGTSGTATAAIGTAGGTVGVPASPNTFTINTAADELTENQYLLARIVKTGTVAENEYSVVVRYVAGKG